MSCRMRRDQPRRAATPSGVAHDSLGAPAMLTTCERRCEIPTAERNAARLSSLTRMGLRRTLRCVSRCLPRPRAVRAGCQKCTRRARPTAVRSLEPGECLLARGDRRGGLLTAGRVEVVARTDGGEPLLMAGQVGVGCLQLGVRRRAAATLELELLVEQPCSGLPRGTRRCARAGSCR